MRRAISIALAALALGCSERGAPEDQGTAKRDRPLASDGSTARAITSTPDRARVQVDLAAVRAALQAYHAERQSWPRSLDDLSFEGRLNYPADLAYDPGTGTVTSRTYPSF